MKVEDLKCCGNCKNNYRQSTKCIPVVNNGQTPNEHYVSDDLCDNWEYDGKKESERN